MGSSALAALFAHRVIIGVGDLSTSNNPSITLSTYGLGSCIAVAAYDPVARIGGLLHVMLPDSALSTAKAAAQPAMFADTGLPLLFRSLIGFKADPTRVRVMLAGGASMLCASDLFKIGERNLRAVQDYLARAQLLVRHRATGGTINRTMHLAVGTGAVTLVTPEGTETFALG